MEWTFSAIRATSCTRLCFARITVRRLTSGRTDRRRRGMTSFVVGIVAPSAATSDHCSSSGLHPVSHSRNLRSRFSLGDKRIGNAWARYSGRMPPKTELGSTRISPSVGNPPPANARAIIAPYEWPINVGSSTPSVATVTASQSRRSGTDEIGVLEGIDAPTWPGMSTA
ncbi:Uncharacterised protein [Mycobacteroides abscessus subsp. abscessus]|nr:Uncharacterised protein [Mycobacteroides abscessus subsp. abscessus]